MDCKLKDQSAEKTSIIVRLSQFRDSDGINQSIILSQVDRDGRDTAASYAKIHSVNVAGRSRSMK